MENNKCLKLDNFCYVCGHIVPKRGQLDRKKIITEEFKTGSDLDYKELGPTCVRPHYRGQLDDAHTVVGPVYLRPQLKGEYDHILFQRELAQSDRYSHLKPEVVFRLLGERRKYTYLKKFAVERLEDITRKQLFILRSMYKCDINAEEPSEELCQSVFSWYMEDFLKRRQLKDFVWVDVLQMTPESCLNVYKFKQDMEQLQQFFQRIFKGLLSNMNGENVEVYEHIVQPINNALKVLEIAHHVEEECEENNRLLKELILKDSVFANIPRDSADQMTKIFLETRILNSHIWNPIETRYQLSWYQNKVKQLQYRLENMQDSRLRDIEKYQQLNIRETWVTGSCMDFYYSNMETIKTRTEEMQTKFDSDYDAIENRIAYKRAKIEKLRDQRKFLKDEILRFHKEIEIRRIREEREAEVLQKKKLEEEALALQKNLSTDKKTGKMAEKGAGTKTPLKSPKSNNSAKKNNTGKENSPAKKKNPGKENEPAKDNPPANNKSPQKIKKK